jgi:hypothetical protein
MLPSAPQKMSFASLTAANMAALAHMTINTYFGNNHFTFLFSKDFFHFHTDGNYFQAAPQAKHPAFERKLKEI